MGASYLMGAVLMAYSLPNGAMACEVSLTGHFVIDQDGVPSGAPNMQWDLIQDRNGAVTGSVILNSGGTGSVAGTASANGRGADLVVTWKSGGRGRYTWTLDQNGRMVSGQTIALDAPGMSARLSSSSSFCQ